MKDDADDLDDLAGQPLRMLARDVPPPRALEQRTVDLLRARALIAPPVSRWTTAVRTMTAVAAAVVLFVAGFLAGRGPGSSAPQPADAPDRFVLLLQRAEGYDESTGSEEAERVAEYGAWARELGRAGKMIGGAKLDDAAQAMVADGTSSAFPATTADAIQGYFVIVAASEAQALAIARTCPHLKHGGRIVIRRVSRT